MLDRIKFVMELANELNKASFSSVNSIMAEYACAAATNGVQCGGANMLADVYSTETNHQYSVKTYRDRNILGELPQYTDFIIERRIAGVQNPDDEPSKVLKEVLQDISSNAEESSKHYNVQNTSTVLLGYHEDDKYFYFRLNEYDYVYPEPERVVSKEFTSKSKNYKKHQSNRSSVQGYVDGVCVYEWIHPNNQTFTRCLKKRYKLEESDTFTFKIKKQEYTRPSNEVLQSMIELGDM